LNRNQPVATSLPPPWFFWPLLALGIALSACGTAAVVVLLFHLPPVLVVSATLAALVVGVPTWYWGIVLSRRATLRRGVAVGAIGSLVAHPLMWMFTCLIDRKDVFGAVDVMSWIQFTLGWTLVGWLYAGWLTTLIGAEVGRLLVSLQRVLTVAAQAPPPETAEAPRRREATRHDTCCGRPCMHKEPTEDGETTGSIEVALVLSRFLSGVRTMPQ
jgi:hypothetical protein